VTQLCPAGSLYDIMRAGVPAREDAGRMFRQIVRGLRYLHTEKRLIHRDVKLENVLVDEAGVCRIADFGMARYIDEAEEQPAREGLPIPLGPGTVHRAVSLAAAPSAGRTHARRERPATTTTEEFQPGSLPYAAPELLGPPPLTSSTSMTGKTKAAAIAGKSNSAFVSHPKSSSATPIAHSKNPAPAQDIWALGVLLYALLMGRLPFVDSFEPRLVLKILGGESFCLSASAFSPHHSPLAKFDPSRLTLCLYSSPPAASSSSSSLSSRSLYPHRLPPRFSRSVHLTRH
jgi:serine/threonine protein kinase